MHLLVVGATGRTGREVVERAASAGHSVRALARSAAERDWPEGVEPFPGDALDPAVVDRAMAGVDAVIVALSMVRTSNFPWAPITTPLDLHPRAARLLTEAAERHGVRRYVMVSAHGAGDSAPRAGWAFLALVRSSNIGVAYRGLADAEAIVRETDLDWTVVRPTRLTEDPATGAVLSGTDLVTTSWDRIPRADVAGFLLDEAAATDHRGRTVSITADRDADSR